MEGHNVGTIGVCLIGGVTKDGKTPEDNFTHEQFETLRNLIDDLRKRTTSTMDVCGHRDFAGVAKACPSFDVNSWLNSNLR